MGPIILLCTIAACILVERIARYRYRDAAFFRDYFTSDVTYLVMAVGLGLWMGLTYVTPLTVWIESQVQIPRLAQLDLPKWVLIPAGLLLVDLGNWLAHVLLHRSDTLWEMHKVHHSSRVVDWLATFRSHLGEQGLRNLMGPMFLIAIGFPLDVTLFATGSYAAFGVFQHSNTRLNLGALEPLFITPRLHRMHHVPGGTCQKNFGTVLTVWDRLAGTFEPAGNESEVFGVPGEVETFPQTWLPQFVEPFRRLILRLGLQHD
jgi:sterol desaturase/sphingolipid hydroxylase (fatty acid hydroxylase superfamily)